MWDKTVQTKLLAQTITSRKPGHASTENTKCWWTVNNKKNTQSNDRWVPWSNVFLNINKIRKFWLTYIYSLVLNDWHRERPVLPLTQKLTRFIKRKTIFGSKYPRKSLFTFENEITESDVPLAPKPRVLVWCIVRQLWYRVRPQQRQIESAARTRQ